MVYVEDVDACFQRALDNGATEKVKVQDQFYGDRSGSFEDPFGHVWYVASHVEDVPPEEMGQRAAAAMGGWRYSMTERWHEPRSGVPDGTCAGGQTVERQACSYASAQRTTAITSTRDGPVARDRAVGRSGRRAKSPS